LPKSCSLPVVYLVFGHYTLIIDEDCCCVLEWNPVCGQWRVVKTDSSRCSL